jgi:hypothetical protein
LRPVAHELQFVGGRTLKQNDPTDHALAAIASIFGPAREPDEGEEAADTATDQAHADQAKESAAEPDDPSEAAAVAAPAIVPDPGIEGYSRSGPGPLDSLRFKWTARRGDDGEYYVDETIGYASRPISSGPIPRDEVIAFIDARESAARQRFDTLRSDMIRGASERGGTQDDEGRDANESES